MQQRIENRRGAMLVLVAVVIVILLVGAVFSVDVAYMHMVRAELRSATDAAARAGAEALTRTQDPDAARAAAIAVAEQNSVAGDGLTLSASDVEIGSVRPNGRRLEFTPELTPFNAVRINARRTTDANDGAVNLFFARFFATNHFQPVQTATASASVRDVALVLDVSGSMYAWSGGGTRLDALKDAVDVFLTEVETSCPNVLISLVSYSTKPKKELDLTNDFKKIGKKVDKFKANGMTAIGNALQMGSDTLIDPKTSRNHALKTVIVMTDGHHNTGPSPKETVAIAVERGHQVHTITFSSDANQRLMKEVAEATEGGMHIHADQSDDLSVAFRAIAASLSITLVD